MTARPSVLCPVDFSEASRGALHYAAAIAEHFYATLIVLTVDEPLLPEALEATAPDMSAAHTHRLKQFVSATFHQQTLQLPELDLQVRVGKPAPEILQLARSRHADLIVMSTRGVTGARKLLFGSTTESVLRETDIPVLVTPAADPGRGNLEAMKDAVSRVLVPVDFTAATALQVRIAQGLAEALGAEIVLAHVLEPLPDDTAQHGLLAQFDAKRRTGADCALGDLRGELPGTVRAEVVVACGDPANEIVRIARERNAGIIVMGLHAAPGRGPRMGSVTYGVLCNAPPLVVALPPAFEAHVWRVSASAQVAGIF